MMQPSTQPSDAAWTVFPTAIGHVGLAWSEAGLLGAQLPEADEAATRARMARRYPALPQVDAARLGSAAAQAMEGIAALMAGEPRDLLEIPLDLRGVPEFNQRVYALARRILPGQTRTYGDLALELGDKALSRAVGQALGHNPFAPVVPCHRILGAGGWSGGFSAHGGALTKMRMLTIEGACPGGTPSLFPY
ncbi:methylated-DNA--[protein]-cysteine S-methyltransferase [Xenophilus azovorans]|uniref:methylated-DNA--[protein]-cysteine S-methyltransferase n=1 Tax=Xenophilus azovorans TaxID=151755 RepID=UPI000B06DCCA|nr:methylated-DNA--[protein]-cysteine S-methyltransferase [Xenophilus azovorans]